MNTGGNPSGDASVQARDVAEYLKKNPKFFEDYADVIAEIFVPHPHGGHAIPIAERQILTLREKNNELEARFRELVPMAPRTTRSARSCIARRWRCSPRPTSKRHSRSSTTA